MIKYEFLIFLGIGLGLGVAELISVRRAIRRDREARAGLTAPTAPVQISPGRPQGGP